MSRTGSSGALRPLVTPLLFLLAIPVAPALHYLVHAPEPLVFATGAIGIAVLADWMRRATEHVAAKVGPAIGGLLNVSFGSVAELILAVFVLIDGKAAVVRAQITGSIIGTSLLGLGIAIVVGGIGRMSQTFKRERAGLLSSLLTLVVIALLLPAVFDVTGRHLAGGRNLAPTEEELSLGVAAVLLALYGANLVYTLVTHRDVFSSAESEEENSNAWPLPVALATMVAATS